MKIKLRNISAGWHEIHRISGDTIKVGPGEVVDLEPTEHYAEELCRIRKFFITVPGIPEEPTEPAIPEKPKGRKKTPKGGKA